MHRWVGARLIWKGARNPGGWRRAVPSTCTSRRAQAPVGITVSPWWSCSCPWLCRCCWRWLWHRSGFRWRVPGRGRQTAPCGLCRNAWRRPDWSAIFVWRAGGGCLFPTSGALLEASASQVVLLQRAADGSGPVIVEWEIVRGALMRRWGSCPVATSGHVPHSLYKDHKTMLEDVGTGSSFTYVVERSRAARSGGRA